MFQILSIQKPIADRIKSPIQRRAGLFFMGSIIGGILNYLFNIIMARESFLGPSGFGDIAALSSLLTIDGIAATALTMSVAYFSSRLQERERVYAFVRSTSNSIGIVSICIALLLIAGSPALAAFLNIQSIHSILILSPILVITVLLGITQGALQGMLEFGKLALVGLMGASLRLMIAVPVVASGYGVPGALASMLVATLIVYGYSLYALRKYISPDIIASRQTSAISLRSLLAYGGPALIATAGLTMLFSFDIILAKHFLTPEVAGQYGGLSTLGKVIYFATLPLTLMMFPIISRNHSSGRSSRNVIAASGVGIGAILMVTLGIYSTVPSFVIRSTIGSAYLGVSSSLFLFALFFTAISFATWLVYIFLAFEKTRIVALPLVAVAIESFLILHTHSSLHAIIWSAFFSSALLLVALSVYALFTFTPRKTRQIPL